MTFLWSFFPHGTWHIPLCHVTFYILHFTFYILHFTFYEASRGPGPGYISISAVSIGSDVLGSVGGWIAALLAPRPSTQGSHNLQD